MKNILSYQNPKSIAAEEYRNIRSSIQYSNLNKKLKTILLTSSIKHEGKSTTTANLATSFAQMENKKVLVIDCDLRNPSIHELFGKNNYKGLSDFLIDEKDMSNYIQETEVPNLHLLTTGKMPPNPSEMLGCTAMKEFLDEVKEKYDYVFLDSPPIGMVSDASALASVADGTVLVVRSEQAEIDEVKDAKKKLEAVEANIVGVVLNAKKMKNSESYYYYG